MKETVDPQIIEQLELICRKFEEAINNNDATAVAELFAEDGVFVTDGGPYAEKLDPTTLELNPLDSENNSSKP